jgi:hypothetical protein
MTMNTQWKDLNSLAQQALKQRFVNQAMAQDWVEQLPQVSLRQLYSYALDPETPDKQKIIHALHTDTHTQQRYMEILQQLDAQEFVNAAAASTQAQVAEGRSPQWRYRLEAASDPLEESYLIIEIAAGATPPSRLFAKSSQYGSKDIVLEKAHRGFIQMVFPNTDLLVKILNQADREVRMW